MILPHGCYAYALDSSTYNILWFKKLSISLLIPHVNKRPRPQIDAVFQIGLKAREHVHPAHAIAVRRRAAFVRRAPAGFGDKDGGLRIFPAICLRKSQYTNHKLQTNYNSEITSTKHFGHCILSIQAGSHEKICGHCACPGCARWQAGEPRRGEAIAQYGIASSPLRGLLAMTTSLHNCGI